MQEFIHAIEQSITHLQIAKPDPQLWSGDAATQCAVALDELIAQLHHTKERLQTHLAELFYSDVHAVNPGFADAAASLAKGLGYKP